jgi:hypothetical protein
MNCVNAHIASDMCNFKFVLWDDDEIGWTPSRGIGITVDGVDYGFVNLPWGTPYAEEIVALPSGEIQLFWTGMFSISYHFKVYNSLDELIYTGSYPLVPLYGEIFFIYQNECPECLPLSDFEGAYIEEEKQVNLNWKAPKSDNLLGFDIFRNDILIDHVADTAISYSDNTAELENGDYTYCVIPVYPFECNFDDECFGTPINVGIKDYEDHIMIYPNPATHSINISGDRILEVKMFNNMGQLILNQHNTNSINISELQNGLYLLSIEVSTKHVIQKKIIIMK